MSAAPDLIVDFVNTLDVSTGQDRLADRSTFAAWLVEVGLSEPSASVTERERRDAVALREHLRTCLLDHHEGADDVHALDAIASLTMKNPMGLRFSDGIAELASPRPGAPSLVASVANAIVALQHDGQWYRVRICPSSDCLEAFHDRSRGGTRRWCSMDVCGNRTKVGSYRRRTRRTHDEPA